MGSMFRKPLEPQDRVNKYEIYGFLQNPFPVDPTVKPNSTDKRENGSIFLTELREQEFAEFSDKFINNESKIGFLMDYAAYKGRGIGKTAFLNYEKNSINNDLGEQITSGKDVIYVVYASPDPNKRDRNWASISRTIYQSMLNSGLFLVAFARLRAFSGEIPDSVLEKIEGQNYEDTIANDKWLLDNGVSVEKVNYIVRKTLMNIGFDISFPEMGLFNTEEDSYKAFLNALSADSSDFFWKKTGTDFLYTQIVRLLQNAFFTHVVVLFDEVEKIVTYQNFAERHAFCDGLRSFFIDGTTKNALDGFFKIFLTIHPNSQELLMPHWKTAGLDRFSELGGSGAKNNTVFFQPIKNTDIMAEKLASIYLENARLSGSSDIYPFTSDALKQAMLKADNIPGKFLKYLYAAIENGVKYKWEKIDIQQINNCWSNNSDSSAVSEDISPLPEVKTML